MVNDIIQFTRNTIELYINDELGCDSYDKYESLNDFDIIQVFITALEIEKNHNKDVNKFELETTIIGCFDNYY